MFCYVNHSSAQRVTRGEYFVYVFNPKLWKPAPTEVRTEPVGQSQQTAKEHTRQVTERKLCKRRTAIHPESR